MPLALELGGIHDPMVRRALEVLSQQFPIIVTGGGGGAPSGPAGGDLGSTYPNPTVVKAQSGFTVGGVAVVLSTDASVTNARTPTGAAGGDLSGTYPNPDIAAGVIVNADINAAAGIAKSKLGALNIVNADVDAAAAIAKTKLANLDVVNADVNAAAAIAESKLNLATDAAAGTGSRRTLGVGALQAAAGNDARFTDARTPTAHQSTHQTGNSDALTGSVDANARLAVSKAASAIGIRRGLNLIEGTGVTMTVADNAGAERVDVTINSSGGGGGGTVTLDSWHNFSGAGGSGGFINSAVNLDNNANTPSATPGHRNAGYRLFPDGTVMLRGLIKVVVNGAAALQLPSGYFPPQDRGFAMIASGGLAQGIVTTTGAISFSNITAGTAVTTFVFLDGIYYDTGTVSTLTFGGSAYVSQAKWYED